MADEFSTRGDNPTHFGDGERKQPTPFEMTDGEGATFAGAPDSVTVLEPGQVIADQFEIIRELGQGGVSAKEHLPATRHNLATLAQAGVDRVVLHLRDPRQSLLSWAHFLEGDVRKRLLAPIWRKTTPRAGFFRQPLAAQIDWHIDHYLPI
ncbi:MAG: hypothetical protein IIB38_16815, partial [Candidatus Hydrogenedentes bacterium]|nr:hypothetical protein [Candidatus Hydrogenedentota bacterium]